ncbi:lipocalin-like protein [Jejuia pallidilutea]|uniref:Lipocalin-like protein n=1 Tax=Jejuia pallidilutea TaxID=504487 RepID=A0A362XBV2_9FLAO|nr:lipocalin family protein [Jejuia pallidilutea]PQV48242.1 lipocalin-like protein [Jejuia pallidilutea]
MRSILSILCILVIFSCSGAKSTTTANKPNKRNLKGTWEVTNIRFVGEEGLYKAMLFDSADSACFKNSEWVFIPNNATGKFTLNQTSNCKAMTQRIIWSFFESGDSTYDFQFKLVDEKNKPLADKKTGYRLKITELTNSEMETRLKTTYQGQAFDVVLKFQKTSDDINL